MGRTGVVVTVFMAAVVLAAAVGSEQALSYSADVEPIFIKDCLRCHGSSSPKKGLDLSSGKGLAAMLDQPSVDVPGSMLLVAGDPEASVLWHKLEHSHSKGRGMPRTLFGARKLSQEELDLIRRWIEQGALP